MRRPPLICYALLAQSLAGGCAQEKPPVVYDSPATLSDLATDLAAAQSTLPAEGYALLTDPATEGRFACDVAVAQFERTGAAGTDGPLALVQALPAEQAYWAEVFRGVPQIRGTLFLSPFSVRLDGPSIPSLCRAARELGADLLIAYTRSGVGPNSADVIGVVYDAGNTELIATVHAAASIIFDPNAGEISPNDLEGDHRSIDARFQSQRSFEQFAFDCVRALIRADQPSPTTQPHRWQQPLVERWWIRSRQRP